MDTDELMRPVHNTNSVTIALVRVVEANTAAFKEIRLDLAKCDGPEKVNAIIAKVELAMQDLSISSQKIPPWVKEGEQKAERDIDYGTVAYGQYPIGQPLNPDNPVPWPPGYMPDDGNGGDGSKKK